MDPIRYVGALLLVGGLLALAIWMLKRLRLTTRGRDDKTLEIISHASLGTREKLVVVRFAGKKSVTRRHTGHHLATRGGTC